MINRSATTAVTAVTRSNNNSNNNNKNNSIHDNDDDDDEDSLWSIAMKWSNVGLLSLVLLCVCSFGWSLGRNSCFDASLAYGTAQTSTAKEAGMVTIRTKEEERGDEVDHHPEQQRPQNEQQQEDEEDSRFSCDELMSTATKTQQGMDAVAATAVNRLRRRLMMYHNDCFERHEEFFQDYFVRRAEILTKRHLILHIPKTTTNGTMSSLCDLVQKNNSIANEEGGEESCWTKGDDDDASYFCPLWCCCEQREPLATCEDLNGQPDVIVNENYWDHYNNNNHDNNNHDKDSKETNRDDDTRDIDNSFCNSQRLLSMTLQSPVDRAIRHVHHYLDDVITAKDKNAHWRLNLIQSNYMTWSLVAGLYSNTAVNDKNDNNDDSTPVPVHLFQPQLQHLEVAKTTMSSMDFLLENSSSPSSLRDTNKCNDNILHYMGFSSNTATKLDGHDDSNEEAVLSYDQTVPYRREIYEQMNQLDIQLYDYALQIMEVDCQFFAGVAKRQEKKGKV